MNADRKLELAKLYITHVADSHDDGEVAVKAHLEALRKHVDDSLAAMPKRRAAHVEAFAARKKAAAAAQEERVQANVLVDLEAKRAALAKQAADLDAQVAAAKAS